MPETPDIRIRTAEPADLGAVRSLVERAKLPTEGLSDQFGNGYSVAVSEGRIVGVAGIEVHGRYGLLRSAAVEESLRGGGLGNRLVLDRLAWAQKRGLSEVWLLTLTAADFFERHGFARVERASAPPELQRSSEFASVCPSTAVCQRLELR